MPTKKRSLPKRKKTIKKRSLTKNKRGGMFHSRRPAQIAPTVSTTMDGPVPVAVPVTEAQAIDTNIEDMKIRLNSLESWKGRTEEKLGEIHSFIESIAEYLLKKNRRRVTRGP